MTEEMKYYSDPTGNIFGYLRDGTQDEIIPADQTALTDEEARQRLNSSARPVTVDALKAFVTETRWAVETGGITLQNGIKVATALDDQNRITTVVANARLAGLESVKFKAVDGFVTLTLGDVEAIAAGIAVHVQACFAAECAHYEAIDAIASFEDPAERQAALSVYDVSQGWPQ